MPKQPLTLTLAIDEFRLDVEWINQPKQYHAHAVHLADMRKEWEACKNLLEVTRAETAKSVRSNPEAYGLAKTTEAAINETVPVQADYKNAQQAVVNARHDMEIAQAAVDALEHRKRALEKLVDLHGRDYFAEPLAKGNKEEVATAKKRHARAKGVRPKGGGDD